MVAERGPVPERLGDFEIVELLGEGGSGSVYAARRGDQEVALKVLREDQAPTGKERQRFLVEAENMQRIDHPGVVRVVDAGELADGRPYLAMERLHGDNLARRLTKGTLDLATALELFEQLAEAVGAMHSAGLIHRDLKPDNVMLVDSDRRAVLLDFGIARPADSAPSTTTQAGMQRGTPAYMAPERFFGARASISTDVYELAVILYVLLAGRLPWHNPMDAQERLAPRRPSELGVALPRALEDALMGALAGSEDGRPSSVRELANQVRAAMETDRVAHVIGFAPTEAAPFHATTRKRARARVGLLAAAGVLLGAGVAASVMLAAGGDEASESSVARLEPGDRQATADDQGPNAEDREPNAENRGPTAEDREPTAEDREPTADNREPTAEDREPTAEDREPTADNRQRTADRPARQPTTDGATASAARGARRPTPKTPRKPRPAVPPSPSDAVAQDDSAAKGKRRTQDDGSRSLVEPTPKRAASKVSGDLSWCKKTTRLYCNKEFAAVDPGGALCKAMRENEKRYAAVVPEGRAKLNETCKQMYPKLRSAARQRIELGKKLDEKKAPDAPTE